MKKRKQQNKRVSGVPTDAKLVAEVQLDDGTKGQLYAARDGAVYLARMERTVYRLLGGTR